MNYFSSCQNKCFSHSFVVFLLIPFILSACAGVSEPLDEGQFYYETNVSAYHVLPTTSFLTRKKVDNTYYYKNYVNYGEDSIVTLRFNVQKGDKLALSVLPVNRVWQPKVKLRAKKSLETLQEMTAPRSLQAAYVPFVSGKEVVDSFRNPYVFKEDGEYEVLISDARLGEQQGRDQVTTEMLFRILYEPMTAVGESQNPGTGDPGTGDPGTGDPGTGDPGTGDPGTGDPGTGDPGTGDPGTGDPGTGDPGTSDPEASNPTRPYRGLVGTPFEGLQNQALRQKFKNMNGGRHNTSPSNYRDARKYMFSQLDNVGGYVECVYTGRRLKTSGIPDGNNMNAEHTWPQSKGGDGSTKADLHHLFPSDARANSIRSNLPFCEVSGKPTWQKGGSKRGKSGTLGACFEPRDSHKGDVARALFYVATIRDYRIRKEEEDFLRKWHKEDPPTQEEFDRDKKIFGFQGSHNYYIMYPDLVDQIDDF